MMTDHPLYHAFITILAVLASVGIGWCIVDAVRRSVKGDGDNE